MLGCSKQMEVDRLRSMGYRRLSLLHIPRAKVNWRETLGTDDPSDV